MVNKKYYAVVTQKKPHKLIPDLQEQLPIYWKKSYALQCCPDDCKVIGIAATELNKLIGQAVLQSFKPKQSGPNY